MAKRGIYLRWGGRRNRADDLAVALGTELVSFGWQTKSPILVPLRYGVQFTQTVATLLRESPDVIVTQHTHPFCSLAAVLYGRLLGKVVVTDCHNGPFVDRIWQRWPWAAIHRFVYANATLNLVHNEGIRQHVTAALRLPGVFRVLHDPIPDVTAESDPSVPQPSIMAICSFAADEPVEALLRATTLLPDVLFFITGDASRLNAKLARLRGDNVRFTGFLSNEAFDRLLASVTGALALSTRDNLLMRACHEALGAAVPLVTTDGPVAREYLSLGTVFVTNDAESIAAGVRQAVEEATQLRAEMARLREERKARWRESIEALRSELGLA